MSKVDLILFITSLITFAISLIGWLVVMNEITILSNSFLAEINDTRCTIRQESNSIEQVGFDILNTINEEKLNEREKEVVCNKKKSKKHKTKSKKTLKSKRAKRK